jgi:hypothetical protein
VGQTEIESKTESENKDADSEIKITYEENNKEIQGGSN